MSNFYRFIFINNPCLDDVKKYFRFAIRRAASDPRVRAKAKETARKMAKGAGEIARDPEPAKKLGRLAGKIKKKIIKS